LSKIKKALKEKERETTRLRQELLALKKANSNNENNSNP